MTESAGLERGYRRLLAWYPQSFRFEQEDEMLAVLMAGAQQGQRRPGLLEAADVIRSALVIRIQRARSGPGNRGWADALALFSVVAPLFLLVADILEVALPYRLRPDNRFPPLAGVISRHSQVGGLSLLSNPGFDIAVGGQVIVAALVLLSLRRMALAAMAASVLYWIVARYWIPDPLQLLCTSVYLLEAAALIASPGPRHGRHLMNWGHGVVLLLAAAAVQVSTLMYYAMNSPAWWSSNPHASVYVVVSIALAVVAVSLAVVLNMNRYFLLLLAAMFYPYVMQVAFPDSNTDPIGNPTPSHLAVLYLPPFLLACGAILTAVMPRRPPVLKPSSQPSPD
jgi:hypothetical protein